MSKFSKAVEKVETFVEEHPILIGYLIGATVAIGSSIIIGRILNEHSWNSAEASGVERFGEGTRTLLTRENKFTWFTPDAQ